MHNIFSLHFSSLPLLILVLLITVFLSSLIFLLINLFFKGSFRQPKEKKRLPPGSMGWPYLGETLKLYTENPNSFFSNRQKRYGDIFKTHILGCPCVMISSPEAAKIVLVNQAHLFKPTYPPSKESMIGPEALFFHQGSYHSRLKKLVQTSFLPCEIKGKVPEIEKIVINFLPTWEINSTINTLHEMKMREQEEIECRIFEANRGLTWDDTRQMPLTSRVIQETLRRASILSFTFREAVQDVEFEGFLIPKGWKVLPLFRSIHHSAHFFPQPDKFDPSRFEVAQRPNTYMPFGNGMHSCPGSELAKLEMLILLHHLTTNYRWEVIGDDNGIQYGPFPVPKGGLPITLHPRNNK